MTAVTVIPDAERNCASADPAIRTAALKHLKWAIDCLAAAGGETLCGPFHQPLGIFTGEPPTKAERANVASVHKDAAAYAARSNIKLSVEPLNREAGGGGCWLWRRSVGYGVNTLEVIVSG